jgi:hypothetical protein
VRLCITAYCSIYGFYLEPPIGIEPMTYALRGACYLAAHALAARIAPISAMKALAALGLSDDAFHARGLGVPSSCYCA